MSARIVRKIDYCGTRLLKNLLDFISFLMFNLIICYSKEKLKLQRGGGGMCLNKLRKLVRVECCTSQHKIPNPNRHGISNFITSFFLHSFLSLQIHPRVWKTHSLPLHLHAYPLFPFFDFPQSSSPFPPPPVNLAAVPLAAGGYGGGPFGL